MALGLGAGPGEQRRIWRGSSGRGDREVEPAKVRGLMGWLRKIFGGADGVRKSMLDAYARHRAGAETGQTPDAGHPPHHVGLFGALASRYAARRKNAPEVVVWGELAPFLMMNEEIAPRALAEYVVFKEQPERADLVWLHGMINSSIGNGSDSYTLTLAMAALTQMAPWGILLDEEARAKIEEADHAP